MRRYNPKRMHQQRDKQQVVDALLEAYREGAFPMADDPPGVLTSLAVLFGVSIVFLFLSWQVARRRDVM